MSSLPRKFQARTLKMLERVPANMRCPSCNHAYQIVVSRKQILGSYWNRKFYRHYRCKVCEYRFRELNFVKVLPILGVGITGLLVVARILLFVLGVF